MLSEITTLRSTCLFQPYLIIIIQSLPWTISGLSISESTPHKGINSTCHRIECIIMIKLILVTFVSHDGIRDQTHTTRTAVTIFDVGLTLLHRC